MPLIFSDNNSYTMKCLVLLLAVLIPTIQCARILGVFPMPGYSHFTLGEVIFKELAARGHEVTVISPFPQKEKIKNYIDVPVTVMNEEVDNMRQDKGLMASANYPSIFLMVMMCYLGAELADLSIGSENIQNLLHSNQTFDLIILEHFIHEAFYGFAHRFNAPIVTISPMVPSVWANTAMGNPSPYSYIPNIFLNAPPIMNLWQRSWNALLTTFQTLHYHFIVLPKHNKVMHKYFPEAPPLQDLFFNTSLMLLNYHPVISAPIPLQPNMIEIGGYHVKNDKPLPKDLKKYLDDAKEGVIYFSMGSNLQSKHLPDGTREEILKAFSNLKLKVLWKWEDDDLPGKPANVRIEKWVPQHAVLAHENVKAFISHGGLLSSIEAIYFGKPILGIPIFGDQYVNIHAAVSAGYGLRVYLNDITSDTLTAGLKELTGNPRYTEVAKRRSQALHDLQVKPMDKAIHSIEYVIKHKGVPHLRNAGMELAWYQYLLLDVIVFYLVTVWVLAKISRSVWSILCRKLKSRKDKVKLN